MRTLAAALLLVSLCSAADPAKSDLAIEEEIRARFAKSKIAEDGFQVKVSRRVATLTGKTSVVQHKGTATRLAKAAGATSVVNNIEISREAREQAGSALAKGRQAKQRKQTPAATEDECVCPPGAVEAEPGPGTVPPPVRRAKVKH